MFFISNEIKSHIWVYFNMIRNHIKYFTRKKAYDKINPYNIPIIINNYNRLTFLKELIRSLEIRGYHNIYIIDNNSTYQPLLEFYQNIRYKVFMLKENKGYTALWDSEVFNEFKDSYYVYTDSDMQIDKSCPNDFMNYFLSILKKYPLAQKVGFGIRIDDLPNHFILKEKVIQHEMQFWKNEVSTNIYRAMIDTTFALYSPFCAGPASPYQFTYRTGYPYIIKHLPWYIDSANINEEETFFLNSISKPTHWSAIAKNN